MTTVQANLTYYKQLNEQLRQIDDTEITIENAVGQRYLGCGSSGLDIMQKLTALNEQGTSIILITHDNHLAQMARRIVTIQDGRIISDEAGKGGLDE